MNNIIDSRRILLFFQHQFDIGISNGAGIGMVGMVFVFVIPIEIYKWKRLPMGLSSATGVFQNLMGLIMTGLYHEMALVYLDIIKIFDRPLEEHFNSLDLVLGRLKDAG